MVDDDGVELKPPNVEASDDVKPSIEASVVVKPSGVSKLRDNEVNTA